MRKKYIRASEIGAYVYCRRAWWLKRVGGFQPQDDGRFAAGELAHTQHGIKLRRSQQGRKAALICATLAILLLVISLWLVVGPH